jgi:hypothetical protein
VVTETDDHFTMSSSKTSGGRERGAHREHFGEEFSYPNFKSKRVKCNYCQDAVSATSHNMKTHAANCSKMPKSIGRLEPSSLAVNAAGATSGDSITLTAMTASSSGIGNVTPRLLDMLGAKVFPAFSTAEKEALDGILADAMPSPTLIGTDLLRASYTKTQLDMIKALKLAPSVILGMDGATNVLSRSMSNIIAHDPRPWFVEYLLADLKRSLKPSWLRKSSA